MSDLRDTSVSAAPLPRVLLLTHAETDLLALERARAELPADFVPCAGHSLVGLTSPDELTALIGTFRPPGLVVVARVHGRLAAVPGLESLGATARREGWTFVAISGVDDADPALAAASTTDAAVAANLTAYFMAGGAANVAQALRYLAHAVLGVACPFASPRVMPAHGLYHPDLLVTSADEWRAHRDPDRPLALVVFYRAHVLSGNLAFVDALVRALESRGLAAIGAFTSSLRDCTADGVPVALTLLDSSPTVVVNTVSFPLWAGNSLDPAARGPEVDCFTRLGAPVIQAIACGVARDRWSASPRGLSPTETAVNVALPECDGRVIAVPVSFKEHHRYVPDLERCGRVAGLAARLARLRATPNAQKRVAIILTNSGGKAARVGGAVGLDTPASLVATLRALRAQGYAVADFPADGDALIAALLAPGSYDDQYPLDPRRALRWSRADYVAWFHRQPEAFRTQVSDYWGEPAARGATLAPARWVTPDATARSRPASILPVAHEPHSDDTHYHFAALELGQVLIALEPPRGFGVDLEAVYHAPDLPPTHHYAAFHGWLAERWRADAVIHFGKHGTLEWLPGKSVALSAACAPDVLLGELPLFYPFVVNDPGEGAQAKRRAHAVIVDHLVPPLTHAGMHGPLATLSRLVEETYRAESLDPGKLPLLHAQIWQLVRESHLDADLREIGRQRHGGHVHEWDERPGESGAPRSLEQLSGRGMAHLLEDLDAYLCELGRAQIRHGLHVFGQAPAGDELAQLLRGLDGWHVPAGPSGAPSRGMAHVLPTGRNFYSVDPRGLPTAAAWTVGQGLAREALDRHLAEAGGLPESIALSIWGTATMRTGGDDVAQALALLGIRPVWDAESRRTTGLEPIPLGELKRPRIDVTLRVSGFFRDAFPQLMQLLDDASRLAASLDEPPEHNFIRKHWLEDTARLVGEGNDETAARRRAGYRVFSCKPGAYGTGLLELIDNRTWRDGADLAEAFLRWGGWAYGQGAGEGVEAGAEFRRRLATVDLALHNQDNREHDLFDSDDYFQFHGGLVATISALTGKKPRAYFGDSSDPARPAVRTLQAEALRVYRSRVVNPKWLGAIRQHGYKGGLEMAATVDYLFGFSATADLVSDWMYEGVAENYTQGAAREFLQRSNPWALHAIAERLLEAHSRSLWQPTPETLGHLRETLLASERQLETPATLS